MADPKLIQLDAGLQIVEPVLYRHSVPGPLAYGLFEGKGASGPGSRSGNSRYHQRLSKVTILALPVYRVKFSLREIRREHFAGGPQGTAQRISTGRSRRFSQNNPANYARERPHDYL